MVVRGVEMAVTRFDIAPMPLRGGKLGTYSENGLHLSKLEEGTYKGRGLVPSEYAK